MISENQGIDGRLNQIINENYVYSHLANRVRAEFLSPLAISFPHALVGGPRKCLIARHALFMEKKGKQSLYIY